MRMTPDDTAPAPAATLVPPPVASSAPLPVPVAAISALAFAAFASAASLRVTDPSLSRIGAEFGVTLPVAAHVITTFSLAYGMLQLVFGPTGDRFGKYRVIGWACAASVVTALLCAWAPNFTTLIIARMLSGAAAAAIVPLSMAWIGDVVPYERRQPVLARFLTGQILGLSTGGLLGGFAADYLGWHSAFIFIAVWFALAALVLMRVQRRLPPPVLVQPDPGRSAVASMVHNMRAVASVPWARVILAVVFLEGATLFGAFAFVATHMHNHYGLSLTFAGGVTLLYGLGGLSFAVASRLLLQRLGEPRMAACGALLLGASFLLLGSVESQWLAAPCMMAAGLGFYMLHNTLQTQATQMAPERRGASVSLFAFSFFVGQSLGVALASYLLRWFDTGVVLAAGGLCVTLVGLRFAQLRARSLA